MFYSCVQSSVTVEVNTLASKCSELIGNAAIVRKRSVIHNKSTCVCLRLPVAASYAEAQERKVVLWSALDIVWQNVYIVFIPCNNVHAKYDIVGQHILWLVCNFDKFSEKKRCTPYIVWCSRCQFFKINKCSL